MPHIPSSDNGHRIHTASTNPNIERSVVENERDNQRSSSYADIDIRHFIPRSVLNYYYARKAGLIPAKDWPRDSEYLKEIDTAVMRCKVRKVSTLRRTVEWDRGFWGRDGRIIRGATRGECKASIGPAEIERGGNRKAWSAPPASVARPLLRLNPPKRPGSVGLGLGPRIKPNARRKALGSKTSAEAGVKKRRKGTVRNRRAGR